jgi:hypothetical protein
LIKDIKIKLSNICHTPKPLSLHYHLISKHDLLATPVRGTEVLVLKVLSLPTHVGPITKKFSASLQVFFTHCWL